MKATLENYNQTPRKVKLVADLVKGKKVKDALAALTFLPKRATEPMVKLIRLMMRQISQLKGLRSRAPVCLSVLCRAPLAALRRYVTAVRALL
jgi:ribosomal protein L22